MMTSAVIDSITTDVIMHKLDAVTEHMADTLVRTCYSPIFYDMNDFSTALFDHKGRLIAQSIGCPVHLAAMPGSVDAALAKFGPNDFNEGDVILLNDPYHGGSHLPDYTFVTPVHDGGELVGFSATRAHVMDVGGTSPGGLYAKATEIFQEGITFPPVKIQQNGKLNNDMWEVILANTRLPQWMAGDLRACIAANEVGKKYLLEVFSKYGKETMRVAMDQILDYAERRIRKALLDLPDGVYTAEDYIDCDGVEEKSVRVCVTITVKGDEMTVDWEGSEPNVLGPINRPKHAAIGDTMFSLKTLLDPQGPANAGWFRPVQVVFPEECFLNAKWPKPVQAGNLETSGRITDVIWQALAKALPEQVEGMTYGGCNSIVFGGVNPRTKMPYVMSDVPPGGWGGRSKKDGINTTFHLLGNCKDMPTEMTELLYPLRVEKSEYRTDSAGPGKYRGGFGIVREYRFLDHDSQIGLESSRSKAGPPGIFGGSPGKPMRLILVSPDGKEEIVAGRVDENHWKMCITNFVCPEGWTLRMEAAGGGGYGDPFDRDPEMVREDVVAGVVSLEEAKNSYGVVLKPETYEVMTKETLQLRS
jgi:N-methylhydantoinase B